MRGPSRVHTLSVAILVLLNMVWSPPAGAQERGGQPDLTLGGVSTARTPTSPSFGSFNGNGWGDWSKPHGSLELAGSDWRVRLLSAAPSMLHLGWRPPPLAARASQELERLEVEKRVVVARMLRDLALHRYLGGRLDFMDLVSAQAALLQATTERLVFLATTWPAQRPH